MKDKKPQEFSILRKLHHKNVVEFYDLLTLDSFSYFSFFELCKFGDLENF